MEFSGKLSENMDYLQQTLMAGKNFDVVYRTFDIAGREACLYFIDGFTKDEVLLKLLQIFSGIKPEDMPANAHDFSKKYLPYGETGLLKDSDTMITQLLSGISCLLIDG